MATTGGPNTEKDGLVFGYDTGYGVADNNTATRFYQGKPSSPLRGTFPSGTTLPSGYVWTYEYDNVVVDAPITDHFLSNQKWVKSTRDTTGSTRVMFLNNSFTSGATYTWSCYVYCIDPNLTSLAMVSHNGAYSADQGGVTYTNSDIGTVKRIHGTWIQQQNGSAIYGMQTNNASIGTQFFMTGFQVEQSDIETPLTSTTRSSTQSLIDLKKTTNIDVSNVSFNSTGQPEFDGTDDRVVSDAILVEGSQTFETVFMTTENPHSPAGILTNHQYTSPQSNFGINYVGVGSNKLGASIGYTDGSREYASKNTTYLVQQNVAIHAVLAYDQANNRIKWYINGELDSTHNLSKTPNFASIPVCSGRWTAAYNDYYFGGNVYIGKIYDKELTADEVKQNFNAYKNRFNI